MSAFHQLLACPACQGPLTLDWTCTECGTAFEAPDGIPNLRVAGDTRTDAVRLFYDQAPFPGYPPRDSLSAFRARAERSRFAQLLDQAIPGDAAIVEIGCGTGQMAVYLAHSDRTVIATDLSRSALRLGYAAASRFGLDRVQFVETDLHRPGLKPGSFDIVFSSGVLHHTPDPARAFACIANLAKPGGMVIVGVYNAYARIPLRMRRGLARLTRYRLVPFDAVLRERQQEPSRRDAWLRDQYRHPEEHRHTVAAVKRWLAGNGIEFVRSFPSTVLDDECADLFAPAQDDWAVETWLAQVGWMWSLGHEGGLFVTVGRRRA